MKQLMENWKRFVNESKEVWKPEKQAKRGKSSWRIAHIPSKSSRVSIPVEYHRNFSRKSEAVEFIEFLNSKAQEENWSDIGSESPSEETLKSLHNTIINSKFKNPNYKYTLAVGIEDN